MHIGSSLAGPVRHATRPTYLLGERDATGQPREGVEVLRGDPYRVAAAAVTLPSEHKCNLERSLASVTDGRSG